MTLTYLDWRWIALYFLGNAAIGPRRRSRAGAGLVLLRRRYWWRINFWNGWSSVAE